MLENCQWEIFIIFFCQILLCDCLAFAHISINDGMMGRWLGPSLTGHNFELSETWDAFSSSQKAILEIFLSPISDANITISILSLHRITLYWLRQRTMDSVETGCRPDMQAACVRPVFQANLMQFFSISLMRGSRSDLSREF